MISSPVFNVACAVEGDYVPHSATMLHSVATNAATAQLHVHYLHGPELSRRSRRRTEGMLDRLGATVSFHEIPRSRVAGLPIVAQFTAAMWYRIFLPDLVMADRVLYIDCDAVVADSLAPLWRIDLGNHALAAVSNVFQANHRHRPAALGLSGPAAYFNSGVLLMNLDEMRDSAATDAMFACVGKHSDELEWPDQDVLNLVFEDRWLRLDPRWNVMNSMWFPQSTEVFGADAVEGARQHPAIRHFEGPGDNKPWHHHCDREHRELYYEHRRLTPWPRYRSNAPQPFSTRRVVRALRERTRT